MVDNKFTMDLLAVIVIVTVGTVSTSVPKDDKATCGPGKFSCDTTRCIPDRWLCDTTADCTDGTDELEENCPDGATIRQATCKSSQFRCDNGFCLPIKWKCDGMDDCGDESDEKKELCKFNCQENEFMCGDGQCITNHWVCDGSEECSDGLDEKNCSSIAVTYDTTKNFACTEGYPIPIRWRCDGDLDCRDGSDERNCEEYLASVGKSYVNPPPSPDEKCHQGEFRCPRSFCILKSWLCDGIADCNNGEDEFNCKTKTTCHEDQFRCKDNIGCIHTSLLCDGVYHCLDRSDEANCLQGDSGKNNKMADEERVLNASSTPKSQNGCNNETHFKCNDGICIHSSKLCNGIADCKDGEDESVRQCGLRECERNNGGCMHLCVDTKMGYHCSCKPGYSLVGKYSCVDVDECVEVRGICSQNCVNTDGSFHCSCLPGYLKDPGNNTRCKAAEGEVYLLFSHSYDIRSLRLRDRDMTSVVQDTRSAIALDYLFDKGIIFWSDKKDRKIYRASLADTNSREVLVSNEDVSADGLAVDWIHNHVYYTDTHRSAVRLLSWDSKYTKTLISEELGHPRAIVVSPHKGYIYWTDWGNEPKIEKAALDGSNRLAIVGYPNVVWPNGLTIDHAMDKIYWCDGRLRTISSANLDGTNVEVILYSPIFLRQPFSISVFEDRLYWTDWSQVALFSADKFTGSNIHNVSAGHLLESPKVVHVYHQYRQPKAKNICEKHSCSHFCLRDTNGEAFCACADGYFLAPDKRACMGEERGDDLLTNRTKIIDKEIEEAIFQAKKHLALTTSVDSGSHIGFIVGGLMGALVSIAVTVGIYVGWTKARYRPIQRIRFQNSVYRKTIEDDLDGRGYIIGQDPLFSTPTNTVDLILDPALTEADDAPLTSRNGDDYNV